MIEPLAAKRIAAARATSRIDEAKTPETLAKRQADFDKRRAAILDDTRSELELDLHSFVADETSYAVIESDARSRRTTTWGQRPGTMTGEMIRAVMQFKGFPTAFIQRAGARALFGNDKMLSLATAKTMGTLLAGMTMAGFASMTIKDIQRGYWPPRDPADPATWLAAFVQGGGAGIYGDFLFGKVNRFGGGTLETAAGPSLGAFAQAVDLAHKSIMGIVDDSSGFRAGDALNQILTNTPFINLHFVRPALDILILNAMREAASPGYLKRQEKKRKQDYGQHTAPILGDRTAFRF